MRKYFVCVLICIFLTYTNSENYKLTVDWCVEPLSYSVDNLVRVNICPSEMITHNFLISLDVFSVWCWGKDIDGSANASEFDGIACRYCELPADIFREGKFATVKTYNQSGVEIHSFSIHDIHHSIKACDDGRNVRLERYRSRPQLYYSVILNDVEFPLILEHDELIIHAVDRFVKRHHADTDEVRSFLTADLALHLRSKQAARARLKQRVAGLLDQGASLRIVIGASAQQIHDEANIFGEWIPFAVNDLDVLSREDFLFYFSSPGSIDAIVAEHMFEHLAIGDALWAFQLCREFLKAPGGYLRVAVPDWLSYLPHELASKTRADMTHRHHTQLNLHSLTSMLVHRAKFTSIVPREYSLEDGSYAYGSLTPLEGKVKRSMCFTTHTRPPSLVLDAFKSITATTHTTTASALTRSGDGQPNKGDMCDIATVYSQGVSYLRAGRVLAAQWALQMALDMSIVVAEGRMDFTVGTQGAVRSSSTSGVKSSFVARREEMVGEGEEEEPGCDGGAGRVVTVATIDTNMIRSALREAELIISTGE
jgi:predicted SAM-dependent methyltransferase